MLLFPSQGLGKMGEPSILSRLLISYSALEEIRYMMMKSIDNLTSTTSKEDNKEPASAEKYGLISKGF